MKKLIWIITALLLFSLPSFSESLNYSDLETADIVAMITDLEKELANRTNGDAKILYPGFYVAGEGLKPGSYLVYTGEDYTDMEFFWVGLFTSIEDHEKGNYYASAELDSGEIKHIEIHEGDIVSVRFGSVIIVADN